MSFGGAENKRFGKNCLVAAAAAIATCCLCYVLYLVGVFGKMNLRQAFS
jgi:hypothetical protein